MATDADCKALIGHIDLPVRTDVSPEYFMIANRNEEGKLYVCKGSHYFAMYPPKDKQKIGGKQMMDPVFLAPYSAFLDHGYMQHVGAKIASSHNMRYYIYIYPDEVNLQNEIVLAYGRSLDIAKVKERNRFVADTDAH